MVPVTRSASRSRSDEFCAGGEAKSGPVTCFREADARNAATLACAGSGNQNRLEFMSPEADSPPQRTPAGLTSGPIPSHATPQPGFGSWRGPASCPLPAAANTMPADRRPGGSMLTAARNDLLTRVGPGTPMGDLLRRYWQPIGGASELDKQPGQADPADGREPGALQGRQRHLRPGRPALPAPPRRHVLRLGRGQRHPLLLPRLALRRDRRLHRPAL